jgi:hypothetical protein
MSPTERQEYDKGCAALHEAGHAVVAEFLKVFDEATIWQVGPGTRTEVAWIGRTHFRRGLLLGWIGAGAIGAAGGVARALTEDFDTDDGELEEYFCGDMLDISPPTRSRCRVRRRTRRCASPSPPGSGGGVGGGRAGRRRTA